MKSKYKLSIIICITLIIAGYMIFAPGTEKHQNIAIAGSTSVQPSAEKLSEKFMEENPLTKITVQGGGSSTGLNSVKKKTAQIGTYSTKLKEDSKVKQTKIASDGITIIVNPSNKVTDLTKEQVKGIFTGEITDWSQVGGTPGKINVVSREDGSGTRDAVTKVALDDKDIVKTAIIQSSTGSLMQTVSSDPNAIGYASLSDLRENEVKTLSINKVPATKETIKDGSYVIQRPFLFLTSPNPDTSTQQFIDWVLGPEGQKIIEDEGLVPVN
ncbi:MAG: phosphate ABC transporter substrate-binding protein [Methanobacteriaceae archaeon]|nr:phosphate ABC transporter substrate-binding protein [Methanobacteriaceae archaeon]